MFVQFTNSQKTIVVEKGQIETLVEKFMSFTKTSSDEVSVNFVDKQEISTLHEEYFDDPSPTDCISFPIDNDETNSNMHSILGEVFVCPEVALEYSRSHALDFAKELTLYLVHGLLHLIGYDDIEENDRIEMRKMEAKLLTHLENNKAFLNPSLQVHAF